jgi:hypothetical protein
MPDYIVTAKVQLVVADEDMTSARLQVLELLDILINETQYRADPNNGRVIELVVEFGEEEENGGDYD